MMTTRLSTTWLALALSFGVLTGCATRPDAGSSKAAKEQEKISQSRVEAQARYAAGLVYELRNENDKALDEYAESVRADPSNEDLALEVSRRLALRKDLSRAVEIAELAARQHDASAAAYAQLGLLYAEAGRAKDAEKANRKAIEMAPDSLASYFNMYTLRLSQGQEAEARAVLDEAARRDVNSADYWLDLAELYANFFRAKPTQKAAVIGSLKACLDRAEKLGVKNPVRRQKLAEGYALAGNTARAVDILLELLDRYADDPQVRDSARQRLLAIYISKQDSEGALKQLEAMVHDHPTNAQANFLLATVAEEKADEFRKKTSTKPDLQKDLQTKARSYAEKAVDYFRKTLQLKPDFEQAYYSLGSVLLDQNENEEAAKTMATARDKFPGSFVAHYFSAVVFARLEEPAKSIAEYTRAEIIAKATSPERLDHVFYFQLGAQQERNKQYDEAAATFKHVLDMKGDFAPALNYLGYMWADQGTHLDEARRLIQKAVDLEPKNAAYLDSLAWVLYKLNQPNLALTYMEDALKFQDEPDATLFDHLGDIQKAAGHTDAARDAWKKSLTITKDPAVEKKLENLAGAPPKSAP